MSVLRRLVPAPTLSAVLLVLWLLLARSWSPGHIVLGAVVGLVIPLLTTRLRLPKAQVRRPLVIVRYILLVAWDVVHSNFEVALGVRAPRLKKPRPGFVVIPLDLRDPLGLAVLAMVTTVVPGTVWSELATDRSQLLLHVWAIGDDEDAFIARYRARYEKPLREIFE